MLETFQIEEKERDWTLVASGDRPNLFWLGRLHGLVARVNNPLSL